MISIKTSFADFELEFISGFRDKTFTRKFLSKTLKQHKRKLQKLSDVLVICSKIHWPKIG